jgi:hypothetical protein
MFLSCRDLSLVVLFFVVNEIIPIVSCSRPCFVQSSISVTASLLAEMHKRTLGPSHLMDFESQLVERALSKMNSWSTSSAGRKKYSSQKQSSI